MVNHWTDKIKYMVLSRGETPTDWFNYSKIISAIRTGGTCYNKDIYLKDEVGIDKVEKELFNLGFKPIDINLDPNDRYACNYYYLRDSSLFYTNVRNKKIIISGITTDSKIFNKIEDLFREYIIDGLKGNCEVCILQIEEGQLIFESIGTIQNPLERANYTDEVLEGFDYVAEQLVSKNPSGRIILLQGEPGTGKSFFIRGLVNQVKAKFVIVPVNQVGELTSPSFVPAITSLHNSEPEDVPIVFIIEDADSLIVNRKGGNMNVLSTLLNVGDGIVGQLFDIRMILSTNAESKIDIDKALLRPGRLNTKIVVGKLPQDKAKEIYSRIRKSNKELSNKKEFTLAEIYGEAENSRAMDDDNVVTFGEYL